MKRVTCWTLYARAEDRDCRVGRFVSDTLARKVQEAMLSLKRPIGYGSVIKKELIHICECIGDLDPTLNLSAREAALAKLTPEDKEVLGIKEDPK